jgi:hypothetical protein
MPFAFFASKTTNGLPAAPLPAQESPVEPRQHQKSPSSRAAVETADLLAIPDLTGSATGETPNSCLAGQ